VLGAGFLLAMLTGQVSWRAWSSLRAAPAAPLEASVEGAPDGRWLRPTDLAIRCDTRVESRGFTYFLAEGGPSRIPVVVLLVGSEPCPAAPVDGGFFPGRITRAWLRETFDVAFGGADAEGPDLKLFTRTITPEYDRKILLRVLPLMGFGLLMVAVGARGLVRALRARALTRGPG